MKLFKIGLAFLAVAAVLLLANGAPQAFHSGGVAECAGCHSMHSPGNWSTGELTGVRGARFLLKGTDQSSACLTCHQNSADTGPSSYHVSTANIATGSTAVPLQKTPGGDFSWVKKGYVDGTYTEDGATHGHNIKAADYGYVVDTTNLTAPGGSYVSSQLGCQGCHDPHGRTRRMADGSYALTGAPIIASGSYNNSPTPVAGQAVGIYRLLRGANDIYNGATFSGVALAVAPSTYNQSEANNQVRVAYGTGGGNNTWGNWCGSCHADMHVHDMTLTHPVDQALGPIAGLYNSYVKSGDLTGNSSNAFTSLVPFVTASGDFNTLKTFASNTPTALSQSGPTTSDEVTCLSCHRAHASGFMYGLRFDIEYEFMVKDGKWVSIENVAATGRGPQQRRGRYNADWQAAYYDRTPAQFATYQRVLCNKCHAKD